MSVNVVSMIGLAFVLALILTIRFVKNEDTKTALVVSLLYLGVPFILVLLVKVSLAL